MRLAADTRLSAVPGWSIRHARWLLVAMHLPFIAFQAAIVSTGLGLMPASEPAVVLFVLAAGALQLRHSLAASRGVRPRYWPWTFLLLLLLCYLPALLFTPFRWQTMQWFVIASAVMLLPTRVALPVVAAEVIGWSGAYIWTVAGNLSPGLLGIAEAAWGLGYATTTLIIGGGGLYAAARLVKAIHELHDAKAELAELAVASERLRISRDLHDLLGHTLSAISLKGDLAIRRLERGDGPGAASEIDSLTAVARAALRDLRDVAHHEHAVSLASETGAAGSLLATAGIGARIDVAVSGLAAPLDELLGWAVREGVTNVLRHSTATTCSISVRRTGGHVRLEMENDGAVSAGAEGNGLIGLAARAGALSGIAVGRLTGDGRFQLLVDVPEPGS
jgi:two-component system sensor histidine kinase DesK